MSWSSDVTRHKAKKRHRCEWCGQIIEVGETYERYVSDYDGFGCVRMHTECIAASSREDWYEDDVINSWSNPRGLTQEEYDALPIKEETNAK